MEIKEKLEKGEILKKNAHHTISEVKLSIN